MKKNSALEKMANPSPFSAAIADALAAHNVAGAVALCNQRLAEAPQDAAAYRHLALLHAASGIPGPAINAGRRACEFAPHDALCWNDLGRTYAMLGEMNEAVSCFSESINLDVKFADGWHNLGTAFKKLGNLEMAFTPLKNALLIDNTRADTYLTLGSLLTQTGQFEDALQCFERAVSHDPSLVPARSRLANQMSQRGKVTRAESLFRQSLAMDPDHIDGWFGLGRTLEDMGEADAALAAYLNVLKRRPGHAMALGNYLALLPTAIQSGALPAEDSPGTWLGYAEQIVDDANVKDEAKALIGYGLTKFHNRRKNYAAAATAGTLANSSRRRVAGAMDREALVARIEGIINTYDQDFFFKHRRLGIGTDQPVFIVGLPRSGTTLTEQIIAAHPLLHGAGELPDLGRLVSQQMAERGDKSSVPWQAAKLLVEPLRKDVSDGAMASNATAGRYLDALREGAPKGRLRISDKSPLNFFNLAFAALLFPNARVIHCQRNARDNALSIWMENFNHEQQWATDFADLAFYRQQYLRLMGHWQEHLPLQTLAFSYEDTVADLESQARRLMDFLQVPWDSACLDFHRNERAVQTPSRWQVRQAIYASSVGRWHDYQPYLAELADF